MTLPSAVTVGDAWRVTIGNTGTANQVNIATVSAQTIDGQSSLALTTYLEDVTLVSDGANWHTSETGNSPIVARKFVAAGLGFSLINGNIIVSVAADAVTFAIKTAAGNDPSAFSPVKVVLRGQTAAEEEYATLSITAATSLTVSTTSTLGTVNSTPFKLWLIGINDGGTYRLGVVNCLSGTDIYPLGQFPLVSSTAEGGAGAADSAHVVYTGSAVTSKPYHVIGYASWESGLGTAGVWGSAPTRFQLFGPGVPLPGAVIQNPRTQTGAVAQGSVAVPVDDSIPLVSEGNEYMTQAITPTSAANVLTVESQGVFATAGGALNATMCLFSGASVNALAATNIVTTGAGEPMPANLCFSLLASGTSSITFSVRAGSETATALTFNGVGGTTRRFGGVMNSYLSVKEIMT
jgi:hypothetical protein